LGIHNQVVNSQERFRSWTAGEDVKKQGAVNCHGASRHDHSIVGVLATVMNVSSFAIWQVLAAHTDRLSLATIVRRIVDQEINHPTIDNAARQRLHASLQLQTLVNREALSETSWVLGTEAYEGYVIDALSGLSQEHFLALFLDARNRLITSEVLFYGSVDTAPVYTRVVALRAIVHHAVSVVVAHNHPSGCLNPSAADREVTDKLSRALQLLDIQLLDHLVVANNRCLSFRNLGFV
jgi:DNA repair protein RadC